MKAISVVGLGSIGMRHAKNLLQLGHTVCGLDKDPKRMKELVKLGGVDPNDKRKLDGVVIATPTETHFDVISKYTDVNLPTFVEKPLGGRGAPVVANVAMVGYNLRFHECVKVGKQWISDGMIGRPLWANLVCAQFNQKPDYLRDGVVLNWSHEIDLALYLLGPAKLAASSVRAPDGHDDMADIILSHDNGCQSTVHLDYVTIPEIRQTIIVGEKATIILDLKSRNAWLRGAAGIIMDHVEAHDSFDENYVEEMKAFIDRMDGKVTIGCTVEEALQTLKICLNVRKQAGLF